MKISWLRILVAAFVLELMYGFFILFVLGAAEHAYTVVGLGSVVVFMAIGGFWVGRRAVAVPVLQGALVGVAALLIYTALTIPAMLSGELEITGPMLLNHGAKILGGGLGGFVAKTSSSRKRTAA